MRTLIVSDLHLGLPGDRWALQSPHVREALVERLAGADRVVLLGDLVELVECDSESALECARPFLTDLRAALGPGREVVIVPGNHDRPLVEPWLAGHRDGMALEQDVPARSGPELARVAELLGEPVRVSYPGIWLRPDVYATHGHYLDAHLKPPPPMRALWRNWSDWLSPPAAANATPADYERALERVYDAIARQAAPRRHPVETSRAERVWRTLGFAASVVAPGLANDASRASVALTAAKVRTGGLRPIAAVTRRLGVDAEHVVFGHVHRAGPLAADDPGRWRAPGGPRLHNPGGWVSSALVRDRASPFAAGRYLELGDDGAPALMQVPL